MTHHTTQPGARHPVFEWRDAVMADAELALSVRIVGYAMSRYMDKDTLGNARPGPDRLVCDTGLSLATVKRALKALVGRGWLVQIKKGGGRAASAYAGLTRVSLTGVRMVTRVTGDTAAVSETSMTRVTSDTPSSNEPREDLGAPFQSWKQGLALVKATVPHLVREG